jgi:hypothetical protein
MNNYMIVNQRVGNLAQFQAAFDELKPIREQYGFCDVGQYGCADDADTVIHDHGGHELTMSLHCVSRNPSDKGKTRVQAVLLAPRAARHLSIPEPEKKD